MKGRHVLQKLFLALVMFPLAMSLSAQTFNEVDLQKLLHNDPELAKVAKEAEKYRLQVLVGLIEKGADGHPTLRQISFRADAEYFYPASSIKLFAAVIGLEKLNQLCQKTGLPIDANTGLIFHPRFDDETLADRDHSNVIDQRITPHHEIRKLFLVSDNQAFNRLYELIGQSTLNLRLHELGLTSAQLVHRLSIARTAEENRQTPKIDLVGKDFRLTIPERTDESAVFNADLPGLDVGRAFLSGGKKQAGAMDFRLKNRISLHDLQRGLSLVVRPDVVIGNPGARFDLTEDQRALLMEAMTQLPRESNNPQYDPEHYPDNWVKFLRPGLLGVVDAEHLSIANKIGRAYGFSTENAWIVDQKNNRSFFLATTLYTNENGVLNDDQYEYETVADPFLAALGRAVARALWNL